MTVRSQLVLVGCLLVFHHSFSYDERCPKGLEGTVDVFKCRCYEFQSTKVYFDKTVCEGHGGMLAKITDRKVNDYLKKKAAKVYPKVDGVWIGARRKSRNAKFYWTDGSELTFKNWADGEPDHLVILDQNCVYMKRIQFWRMASLQCAASGLGFSLPSICQYDIANCKVADDNGNTKPGSAILIAIVAGSVVGGIFLCLILCCIVVRCKSAWQKYRKNKSQRRSVRYYSRPPSTCARQQSMEPRCHVEDAKGENDLNEQLVLGGASAAAELDSDSILNVKGATLPTADSIAADAEGDRPLVVDLHTGRSTVKRINGPPSSKADNASTRSLKSFMMDGSDRVSHDQMSHQLSMEDQPSGKLSTASSMSSDEDNAGLLANLDNVDKPSNHPTNKDVSYK